MTDRHHRTMTDIRRLTSSLLDLAFPATCSGCGREGPPLCDACRPALDARLALPAGRRSGSRLRSRTLLQLDWCAPYGGAVRAALHDLKYAGERRLAEPLGLAVARRWCRIGIGAEVVVPVPVHAERERRRGYDQATLIAAVVARELRLPLVRALQRARSTVAQFELGRDERAANVAGAFRIRDGSGADPAPDAWAIRGRWVLLVDDVVTTGSTLAACADVLETAGARAISAIAVARER